MQISFEKLFKQICQINDNWFGYHHTLILENKTFQILHC